MQLVEYVTDAVCVMVSEAMISCIRDVFDAKRCNKLLNIGNPMQSYLSELYMRFNKHKMYTKYK